MKMISSKKGLGLGDIQPVILVLGVSAIVLAIVMVILANVNQNASIQAFDPAEAAVNQTITSIDDFVTWFPLFVLIVAAVIILGLVFMLGRGGAR